jgi:ammonia channel protein AmtB
MLSSIAETLSSRFFNLLALSLVLVVEPGLSWATMGAARKKNIKYVKKINLFFISIILLN